MTKEQAAILVDELGVEQLLENMEEVELLMENNLELLNAYKALYEMAVS